MKHIQALSRPPKADMTFWELRGYIGLVISMLSSIVSLIWAFKGTPQE